MEGGSSNPRSTTSSGSSHVIDLTEEDEEEGVVDLVGEEEEQVADARHRGELTFHTEIERARVNPAPEYQVPPPYDSKSE